MLKKTNRLSTFQINSKQQIFDTPLFKVKISISSGNQTKIGLIVSKKIDKRAVYRNKLKRKLSRTLKLMLPEIKTGVNIIIVAKKEAQEHKAEDLVLKAKQVFKKANILK